MAVIGNKREHHGEHVDGVNSMDSLGIFYV